MPEIEIAIYCMSHCSHDIRSSAGARQVGRSDVLKELAVPAVGGIQDSMDLKGDRNCSMMKYV